MFKIRKSWFERLKSEFEKEYFKTLQNFLNEEYSIKTIYPSEENVFNALNYVPYENVKVVIIGQDPYHQPHQAMGLSFSVPETTALPPSLQNIYKEIASDLGITCEKHGDLSRWAKQGVLLLNTVLTVRQNLANSHKGKGWEEFTQTIIKDLGAREKPMVFILWGRNARIFEPLIGKQHLILSSAHPSPLSAYNGFFGCKHFSKCNEFLKNCDETEINWQ